MSLKHSFLLLGLLICSATLFAQVAATLSGVITDPSGAAIVGAKVQAINTETDVTNVTVTNERGHYHFATLPVGSYQITVEKQGFQIAVRGGIRLFVNQDAEASVRMEVGRNTQVIEINDDATLISLGAQDISGVVDERAVKELPLNGRSFDLLLPLNPGIVNFTAEKTGGVGVSNSTTGNNFAVSGNRPQQNLFLLNGIEFTGAAENNMQPGGASQQLLGVDAVREFNVLRDNYSAEYGKRPGGQVLIVTQSGTNQWHGSVFEFLRNSALDAPNYFDQGSVPPFQRNQFGASLGGPLSKDKTFVFANYEGLRQQLSQTSATFVPDLASRVAATPSVRPLLDLWPTPPAGAPDFNGIAEVFSIPQQRIREDFGTAKFDHTFGLQDSFSAAYTVDDGHDVTATVLDPYSTDVLTLREQVLSAEETHIFSPVSLNTARFGFSRAGYFFSGEPTPGTPAAIVRGFLLGHPVGAVVVGGSAASNPQAQLGLAGSNNGSNLRVARNLYTLEDRFNIMQGRHEFSAGVWLQPFQSNETLALSQFGQATFSSLQSFLQGNIATFLYDPAPTPMNWRSLFGAWYVQDALHITRKLLLTIGFRGESSTGWNEAHGHAANYFFNNGSILSQPHVGDSVLSINRFAFLAQPRIGLAWSPFGQKAVVRAGFGIYNELQDALGYRTDQIAPFNPTYSISGLSVAQLPLNPAATPLPSAKLVPGGVQPDLAAPTLISWTLGIEQALSPNTALSIRYVGSHGYHEITGIDANEPFPTICPAAPCPANYPSNFPAGLANTPVPAGAFFIPAGASRANPALANTWTWFSIATSSYNAMQIDLRRRFDRGLSLRASYTWSKALDDGDSLNGTTAGNAPGLVANPFDIRADWGPATYDVRHSAVISAIYELPFGRGHRLATSRGWSALAGGWSVDSIFQAQSGFPFTPQLSYNPSNNGDTRNPVRPFINPNFNAPVILGRPDHWFDPNAFLAPPPNSGFYGNVGRNAYTGPGLATWDFAAARRIAIHERLSAQLRAELFNLLNRANFSTPNLIVFTPAGVSGSAGTITSTATTSRQVQFGLKLLW